MVYIIRVLIFDERRNVCRLESGRYLIWKMEWGKMERGNGERLAGQGNAGMNW
jgi:hypothetical protein